MIKHSKTEESEKYYISENLDLRESLDKIGASLNPNKINAIQQNTHNNRIGYYQFTAESERYIKLFILPKTLSFNNDCSDEEVESKFVDYLKKYNELKQKNIKKRINQKYFDDNIAEIDISNIEHIDDYFIGRYQQAISAVEQFFKRHKSTRRETTDFTSQNISQKLDMRRNVLELNKSKVHQTKAVEINYSFYANITYAVLHYFKLNILHALRQSPDHNSLYKTTLSTIRLLKRSFSISTNGVKVAHLTRPKTKKAFNKNLQLLSLHDHLITLVGVDSFNQAQTRIQNSHSIFYSPDKMFELHLDDILTAHYTDAHYDVHFQFQLNTRLLNNEGEVLCENNIFPDHVLARLDNAKSIILDSKWKNIDQYSDISEPDCLKLYRDKLAYLNKEQSSFKDNDVEIALVYPECSDLTGKQITLDYAPNIKIYLLAFPLFDQKIIAESVAILNQVIDKNLSNKLEI